MILPLPRGAADCHMHVLGPFDRFPLAAERAYNVPEASLENHERMKRSVGLERTVFVQASGHGFDNRAMLAALAGVGSRGRGVAVLPLTANKEVLVEMHAQGVRGVRLNFLTLASRHGGEPKRLVSDYGAMLSPMGWHLQVFANASNFLDLEEALAKCKAPVVIDHMGLPEAARGVGQPGFQAVLRLAKLEHVWVKLAGADRVSRSTGRLRDAIPYMQALASVAPKRLVWGSDWPHIGFHSGTQVRDDAVMPHRALDAGALLSILAEAVPDAGARQAILSANPAALYGFEN